MTTQLHPQTAAVLEAARQAGRRSFETMEVAEARAAYDASRKATMAPPQEVAAVEELAAPRPDGSALPIRLYRPLGASGGPLPLLVYFHGGGWVLGGLQSHDGLCRRLANAAGCAVASVDYRLAPEHPFPAPLEDAELATAWLAERAPALGLDPQRLAVGGDSAGANLAIVVAIGARDGGGPALRYQLHFYPLTDLAMDTPSQALFAEGHLLTRGSLAWFAQHYLGAAGEPGDWRISPLRAPDLSGLPPAYVMTASHDPLRDEGERFAQRLIESGVVTTVQRAEGQIHGFLPMDAVLDAAVEVLETAARHLALGLS